MTVLKFYFILELFSYVEKSIFQFMQFKTKTKLPS